MGIKSGETLTVKIKVNLKDVDGSPLVFDPVEWNQIGFCIWDKKTEKIIATMVTNPSHPNLSEEIVPSLLEVQPDNTLLATLDADKTVEILDTTKETTSLFGELILRQDNPSKVLKSDCRVQISVVNKSVIEGLI